ncbi:zinc finger protein 525-like [Perca flavescens]|uniref:zinc finger protein 525-like n=1 Tax=Perca flavescens TaxID=8167 RepID=UPI00106EA3D2|nr:zinc finger protein 525-like [Perca flavescens]
MDTDTASPEATVDVKIKSEPDDDVEICWYPVLKKLSVKLTDCRPLLEGRDFLSLDAHPQLRRRPPPRPSTITGRKMVYCPDCHKGFYKQSHLEAHRRTHGGQKANECWQCGKTYPTLLSLVLHQQVHDRARPYKCSHCDQTFALKRDWKTHHRTHSGK